MDSDVLVDRERAEGQEVVQPTDVADPSYFHKVVDCQWACPAHTPSRNTSAKSLRGTITLPT